MRAPDGKRVEEVFRDLARGYVFGRVVASTREVYQGAWQLWVKWRKWRRKSYWLKATASEMEVVDELAGYMVYCCAALGNQKTTIAEKIVAVDLFYRQWTGRSSPLNYF